MTAQQTTEAPSLREKKRRNTERLIRQTALRLFQERGFDAVTIDDLATACDISRRTFFRYFPSKEDVIFARRMGQLALFQSYLKEYQDKGGIRALRKACLRLAESYMEMRTSIVLEQSLIRASNVLSARDLDIDRQFENAIRHSLELHWKDAMVESNVLRRNIGFFSAAAMGVLRVVVEEWSQSDASVNLVQCGKDAFDWLMQCVPMNEELTNRPRRRKSRVASQSS